MFIAVGMCIPVIAIFGFLVLKQYLIQRKLVKLGVHRTIVAANEEKLKRHHRKIAKNQPSNLPNINNNALEQLAGLTEKKKLITSNPSCSDSESYSDSYGGEDREKGSPSPKGSEEEEKLRQKREEVKVRDASFDY